MRHFANITRTTMMKKFIAHRTVIEKKVLGEQNCPIKTIMSF